ncbi:exonuclease SbcC [Nocardioides zeae]|uniref:Exonuclease SbcC n=1 Tax=Nocardioides imazamoxiresistens TaxID=3231893 RepID=A0ABU3PSB2_9ACTN|nr:exonuclease SbcC [Nocardioides zeae]MDT9592102.1 exonuclease SbcC [Nocardioides zeae]
MADLDLTVDELRAVTAYALETAAELLDVFEAAHPDDLRPREALAAARAFVSGAPRGNRLRVAAVEAHRAAASADGEPARLAARAAGDAAAAAYLHPIARATQVGHVLRAAALAARVAELEAGDPAAAEERLTRSAAAAEPVVVAVLRRYPPAPDGRSRVAELVRDLDKRLRARRDGPA